MPNTARLTTCQELMLRLVETLETYMRLSRNEKRHLESNPVYHARGFLSKRQLLLNRSLDLLKALKAYEDLLKAPNDNILPRLQNRFIALQTQCEDEDRGLIAALTARKASVAERLHQLFHAKKTLRGYGKQSINAPRFLDSSE
jgi:hypothetical protein